MKRGILTMAAALLLGCASFTSVQAENNTPYKLVWSDEFEGDTLNTQVWNIEEGYIANNELQDYQRRGNHSVSDGTLRIIAKKVNDDKKFGSYTSARLNTYKKQGFTYGRIEARMKLPKGLGTWPAFWMLGNSIMEGAGWPACGEIDIMEYVGFDPQVIHATLHSATNNHVKKTQISGKTTVDNEAEWHTYGVIWEKEGMAFYIDSPSNVYFRHKAPEVRTLENWPFDKEHFIILNLAIGGMWGGAKGIDNSIFDTTMEIDYVRVYQKKSR